MKTSKSTYPAQPTIRKQDRFLEIFQLSRLANRASTDRMLATRQDRLSTEAHTRHLPTLVD